MTEIESLGADYARALLHKERCLAAKVKSQVAYDSACLIVEEKKNALADFAYGEADK